MLTIKVEATAGCEITEAFVEAITIADKLNCFVQFDFNGVTCIAHPGGNPKKGAEIYHSVISDDSIEYKFSMS